MNIDDVLTVCQKSKATTIICVHLEAINYCYLRRNSLKKAIATAGEYDRCRIPEDGEIIAC